MTGRKYKRGNPKDDMEPLKLRNEKMWSYIEQYMPTDRKLRVLELGSGRGSLTRYVALKLQQLGKLELIVGVNLSQKENDYNEEQAKLEGIPEDLFQTLYMNFDDLTTLRDDSFDLILSNDSLLHASNKILLSQEMARLLRRDGVTIFSDILLQRGVTETQVPKLMERFHLTSLGTLELYDAALELAGLKKILLYGD